jgi:nucleoside-diphosphate-sugar epimerase
MVESTKKKVVITGISGFLGSQVCDMFLKDGTFTVRGTVRDKNNEKKLAPLRKAFGEKFSELELVEADLLKPETLDLAIAGCDFVVHTASPFPLEAPKDENVLIKPAVEGTMAVMRAAHRHKVKRVVVTSSCAAVMVKAPGTHQEVFNENDWSDVKTAGPYEKSKTLAEKAAWDFVNGLPDGEKIELVTINPVLILGPSIIAGDFSSGQVIKKIMTGEFPGMPKIMMPVVDVRDVALAHLQGLKVSQAANKRFCLSCDSLWFKEYAETLKEAYPDYSFKTGELGYCPMKVASWFDKTAKMILPMWGKTFNIDNSQSRDVLGIQYHDAK